MLLVLLLIPVYLVMELPPSASVVVKAVSFVSLFATFLPWFRTCYMDSKTVLSVLFNIPNLLSILLMSPMVVGFMQAYHLARAMDLSWGNRPGMDMQLLSQNTDDVDDKRTACSVDRCLQHVSKKNEQDDGDLCENHSWMKHNILVWKFINSFIVELNIIFTISLIFFAPDTLLIVVCSIVANIHTLSILIMIPADILTFVWKCLRMILCSLKSLLVCRSSEASDVEYTQVNEHTIDMDK